MKHTWFGSNIDGYICDICGEVKDFMMRLDVDIDNAAMSHICPECIYNHVKMTLRNRNTGGS